MKLRIKNSNIVLLILLVASTIIMGIGYAAINSVTGEINVTVSAEAQEGVFITNVELVNQVDADIGTSNINNYIGTIMNSTVALSTTNPNSEIVYKVTVYNRGDQSSTYLGALYDEEFYDNLGIVFEVEGILVDDEIAPKETKEFTIKFKYKDGVIPESNILNSYINFKFGQIERLLAAEDVEATGKYLGSTIEKDKIESITFELGSTEPKDIIVSFDASEKQNKSIIGYYTDTDGNGLYELKFLSEFLIAPNVNGNYLFQNLINMKEISFNNFTTYGVETMYYMFFYCTQLTTLDLSSFDTSKVTTLDSMFLNCNNLIELDLSNFNTELVEKYCYMFYECSNLQSLEIGNFVTSNADDMTHLFYNCYNLESIDLKGFNTSKVDDMSDMFSGCNSITSLDLSNFDTSQVIDMSNMFKSCNKLSDLDLGNFDTSQVTDMSYMFRECSSLENLNISNFNTSQVTDMSYMFRDCGLLSNIDISSFDTSQVTDMSYMFRDCTSLTELDLGNFNTYKVTNMYNMFKGDNQLRTIYVKEFDYETNEGWTTDAVTDSENMFQDCSNIVGQNGTVYASTHIDKEYARIDKEGQPGYLTNKNPVENRLKYYDYLTESTFMSTGVARDKIEDVKFIYGEVPTEGIISQFDASENQDNSIIGYYTDNDGDGLKELTFVSKETIYANKDSKRLFFNFTQVENITFDNFSTKGTTNMLAMFSNCYKLTKIDVSKFDTSEVTTLEGMFGVLNDDLEMKLEEIIGLENFDTSKVLSMYGMFMNCKNLKSINLSSFNTSNVRIMLGMFCNCKSLTSLDVTNFDTSNVTNMQWMFYGCSGLTELDISNFNTSKVTNMKSMFYDCSSLTSLDLTKFNTSQVTDMSWMFWNCASLIELDLSNFDTSNVTTMEIMIADCKNLKKLNISGFNTSKVTNMAAMFQGLYNLTSLDVSSFDTSNVTNMTWMFWTCLNLETLDLSNFNTSKVTDMSYMFTDRDYYGNFQGTPKLKTIYVSEYNEETDTGWTTKNVTNSEYMFTNCTNLVGGNGTVFDSAHVDKEYARIDKEGEKGYLTNKIYTESTLMYASDEFNTFFNSGIHKEDIESISFNFNQKPTQNIISSFDMSENQDNSIIGYYTDENNNNLYELTISSDNIILANPNSKSLFAGMEYVTSIKLDNFYTKNVTNMQSMFQNCYRLQTIEINKENFDTSKVTDMSYMFDDCQALQNIDVSELNTEKVTDMSYMFSACENINNMNLKSFNTSQVTNMQGMFQKCYRLMSIELDLDKFNTSQVVNMSYMFDNCQALQNIDVSKLNTEKVTDMSYMFSACESITNINLKSFNTNKVTNMQGMFQECYDLEILEIDIDKFNTSLVTDMSYMFDNCQLLGNIDVSKFNTTQVINMAYMFFKCESIMELDLSSFNTNSVTNMESMFQACYDLTKIYVGEGWLTNSVSNSSNMFLDTRDIVGGNGTTYDALHIDKEYARIDTAETPGYFTNINDKQ